MLSRSAFINEEQGSIAVETALGLPILLVLIFLFTDLYKIVSFSQKVEFTSEVTAHFAANNEGVETVGLVPILSTISDNLKILGQVPNYVVVAEGRIYRPDGTYSTGWRVQNQQELNGCLIETMSLDYAPNLATDQQISQYIIIAKICTIYPENLYLSQLFSQLPKTITAMSVRNSRYIFSPLQSASSIN
jgi:hypothetical protein